MLVVRSRMRDAQGIHTPAIASLYTLLHGGGYVADARARLPLREPVVRVSCGRRGAAGRGKDRVRGPGERRVRRRGTGYGWGGGGARAPVEAAPRRVYAGAADRRGRCRRRACAGGPQGAPGRDRLQG